MRIAEVALRVRDLETSVAFYREHLGFDIHLEEPGVTFLEVGPLASPLGDVGHPQLLALFKRDMEIDETRSAFDHIAFEIEPGVYDTMFAQFQTAGMVIRERVWPDTLLWRGRSFFFRDPDGNVVELIAANMSD